MIKHKLDFQAYTKDGWVYVELSIDLPFQITAGTTVYLPHPLDWDHFALQADDVGYDIEEKLIFVSLQERHDAMVNFTYWTGEEIKAALSPLGYEVDVWTN